MAAALFIAAALFLLIATHPFIGYPLSLRALRLIRRRRIEPADGLMQESEAFPTFAVCVCAYNEAPVIERTILNLLDVRKSLQGNLQILLYVDGARDGTAEIAGRYAGQVDLVVSAENRGKSHGLNRLADHARAEILVLIDANVQIAPDAFANLRRYFADPSVGCVCGHLTFVNAAESATSTTGSLYWRLEEHIKQLESDIGSVMGADGSLYAIRRERYRMIPNGVADDMYLSLSVLCDGYRIVRAADVRAYERMAAHAGEEFRRKVRIACQGYTTHLELWSKLRRLGAMNVYKYLSHKLLRWFTLLPLACAFAFGLAGLVAAAGLSWAVVITSATLALLWAGWRARLRPITLIADILQSFAATAFGVWRALNGTLIGTWEPAGSVRKTKEIAR
jgi:cellulose synthase/poly-beta-1,6-N-acetylglucosamine synthase-like glycosyltransferase